MSRKASPYNQVVQILHQLHKDYPSYNMGRHLSTALDGYGDIWGLPDKEILFALQKYQMQLESDIPPMENEEDIERIIKDAMNLDDILKKEYDGNEDE